MTTDGHERLPESIFSAAQVRDLDRIAIEQFDIAGYELMCRAGRAALAALLARWPRARQLAVACGAGNNAGDGYVLARLARNAGFGVRAIAIGDPDKLKGDASRAWRDYEAAGGLIERGSGAAFAGADVVVDALLGTGLTRTVEGEYAAAVAAINAGSAPVLALDIPSGLDADSGLAHGVAVRAAATITFVGLKQGLFLGDAPEYCGELEFSDLAIPAAAHEGFAPVLSRLALPCLRAALPRRPRASHKGANGRLLLVGGAPGTSGAIRLAGEAALRTGAGLVYVATHPDSVPAVMAGRPELMCRAIREPDDLVPLLAMADAAVLGPGLGQSEWSRELWRTLLASALPLVVDADGLNLLSQAPEARGDWILTPHPGEAARLLGLSAAAVQSDRRAAVEALAARYGAVAVLKGAGSLVAAFGSTRIAICDRGNPGMATAGTGDVLAGVLGALVVQCRDLARSAEAGVLLHALAGDDAAVPGERGTVAGDLMPHLRRWANPS